MGPYSFTFVSRIDRSKILRSSGRHEAPEYGIPSRSHAHHIRFHSFPETNPLAVPGVRLEPSAEAASSRQGGWGSPNHRPSRPEGGPGQATRLSAHPLCAPPPPIAEGRVEPHLTRPRDWVSVRVTCRLQPAIRKLKSAISNLPSLSPAPWASGHQAHKVVGAFPTIAHPAATGQRDNTPAVSRLATLAAKAAHSSKSRTLTTEYCPATTRASRPRSPLGPRAPSGRSPPPLGYPRAGTTSRPGP